MHFNLPGNFSQIFQKFSKVLEKFISSDQKIK